MACLHAKLHLDLFNRLATIHQRHRHDRTDNGPITQGEPFYKRSPKNGSCSYQTWSGNQWTLLLWYLTVSANIRCYQTRHGWQFCFSARQSNWATQSNWCSVNFQLPFSWSVVLQQSIAWLHWLQDLRSHTAARVWVASNKTEEIKQRSVKSGDAIITAFEWKDEIFMLLRFSV